MERPTRNSPDVKAAAIAALAKDCADWDSGITVDKWSAMLGKCYLGANGYEVANELDRYHHVSGIDAELVRILDSASSYIWSAHRDAVKAWAAETKPAPELKVGDRISHRFGDGTISEIRMDEAVYLYVPDAEKERFAKGGGVYLNFEDAVPEQVPA